MRSFFLRILDKSIHKLTKLQSRLSRHPIKNNFQLDSLSPVDSIDDDTPYFEALNWALQNRDIKNIAVTGPYGSGKSSIIRSFQKKQPKFNYLNISLASFKKESSENPTEKGDEIITLTESRLIEISILQQIFYKVKSKEIPDSRFKRIRKFTKYKAGIYTTLIVAVLVSLLTILYPRIFDSLPFIIPFKQKFSAEISYAVTLILLLAAILLCTYLLRFLRSRQFERLNLKDGEIEIGAENEKSILNKHLDEILYFFEATRYDIVIFEDLDRFKNHDIFTKLREINFLLNNSRQINRKIIFIYAIRDDIFLDKTRTKFFEFILPVLPVVNWHNSYAILLQKLQAKELNLNINESFIRDITLYIDDMRILKNIFNEFVIYKENLKKIAINQNQLLGLIVYKNIYPTDFALLHENKGIVYAAFNKIKELKNKKIEEVSEEINRLKMDIDSINNQLLKSTHELRSIYLTETFSLLDGITAVKVNGEWRSLNKLNTEEMFSQFMKQKRIEVISTQHSHNTGETFSDIEKKVNPYQSYQQRAEEIENKNSLDLSDLQKKITELTSLKNQTKSFLLKEFLEFYPETIDLFSSELADKSLLKYLLREGYIDEMYTTQLSYFYEGSLTKNDMDFLLSIKNKTYLDPSFKLTKIDEIIRSISQSQLKREEALNFHLIDYLLDNKKTFPDEFHILFSEFNTDSQKHIDFTFSYIDRSIKLRPFINALSNLWANFWLATTGNKRCTPEIKEQLVALIICHGEKTKFKQLFRDKKISEYISNKPNFLLLFPDKETHTQVKEFINEIKPSFKKLDIDENNKDLFLHIYISRFYSITEEMIYLIVKEFGTKSITKENLATANYTSIQKSGCNELIEYIDDNIEEYISNVFLKIQTNEDETEESLIILLNKEDISLPKKHEILKLSKTILSDITEYPTNIWNTIIEYQKIPPSWPTLIRYFATTNSIDLSLSYYLNIPDNYIELSKKNITFPAKEWDIEGTNLTIKDTIEQMSMGIVEDNSINDIAFEYLLKSIPIKFDESLDLSSIEDRRMTLLINLSYLSLTPAVFDALKDRDNLKIELVAKNISTFIKKINEYKLSAKDAISLLTDQRINDPEKIGIINSLANELITGQQQLADTICKLISNIQTKISFEKLKKILTYSSMSKEKIILLINQISQLSEEEITSILTIMGSPYSLITEHGKRPTIPLSNENIEIAEKLKSANYISSYKIKNEDGLIRFFTKSGDNEFKNGE